MLPCKKRRTVTESVQEKDDQGEDDLESAVKPEPDDVKDLGPASLSWSPSHGHAEGPEVQSLPLADNQLGVEEASLSCSILTQHTHLPVLEAVDVAISQGLILPSLESSHPHDTHTEKGKLPATPSRRGKKVVFKASLLAEDRGDHPVLQEPSGDSEDIIGEGGKPQMYSEEDLALLPSDSQSAPREQPRTPSQPEAYDSPQETALSSVAHQAEEETEDGGLFIPMEEQDSEECEKRNKKKKGTKRKRDGKSQEQGALAYDLKLDDILDRTLEDGAKQHNLTAVNVRNILHEVITNEHVVAMMKAAISETEDMPLFEPKMTRSKLKEVVEKGVVIPTWNISPIKKANEIKPPQFVDIHLEEDDSSDEEYQPDEEEEDETAEESLLESDVESTASSPRGAKRCRLKQSSETAETDEESSTLSEAEKVTTPATRHISAEVVPMGPPPPPKPKPTKDSTFMEKLHAVDEELASSPVCMDSFQPMDDSLIAFRTRSKMPLKDVPLGQLEAELQAPDITPDMYDPNTADDEEWKVWLGGLISGDVGNEDEADDDDDPEYNFLDDPDEPDTEDFRTDRAVRITKKEVNGLMEELFETFQDEMGFSNMEDDGPEEEERVAESRPNFNTPQALRFEEPLANLLNERHRTVKELLEQLKLKKSSARQQSDAEKLQPQKEKSHQSLIVDPAQRSRLQQQMQQHVQLLTQIYLLTSSNPSLSSEANTTRIFLKELGTFADYSIALHQQFNPKFQTLFQPCNWMEAMQLIEDFNTHVSIDWSPCKTVKKTASEFPCLPKQVAWILATSKVFMYPELLPICSLKATNPQDKIIFTKAEDNLLALGLKHFEGTELPKPLISKYLVTCKTAHQLTVRIKNLNMNRAPNNIIKFYKKTKQLPVLVRCCEEIQPHQWKPPVEREEHRLPFWLKASLQSIQEEARRLADGARAVAKESGSGGIGTGQDREEASPELSSGTRYPLLLPKGVVLKLKPVSKRFSRKAWRQKRPSVQKPLLIQPSPSLQPSFNPGKIPAWSTHSEVSPSNMVVQIPHLIQPAPVLQTVPMGVSGGDISEAPTALPAVPPGSEARTRIPLSDSQAPRPSAPAPSVPKVLLPSLGPSKFRKPYVRRKPCRRRGTKASPCLKPAPIIHPTPVIFTVPATTVKVVSLASGCNVIQPVSAAVAPNPQTIPITTLLVNPTSFSCPLNQPLVASSISPLIVSGNSLSLPVPSTPEEKAEVNMDIACSLAEGKNALQGSEPKSEAQELTPLCAGAIFPKEEPSPGHVAAPPESQRGPPESSARSWTLVKAEGQEGLSESSACRWTLVKAEEGSQAPEPMPRGSQDSLNSPPGALEEPVKLEPEERAEGLSSSGAERAELKEELCAERASTPAEGLPSEHERGRLAISPAAAREPAEEGDAGGGLSKGLLRTAPAAGDPDTVLSRPPGKPEEPAGPEAGGEKDGPEEEEEEDFDDLTQDEEDEMSSASEESVLSVPELQETMEKLTWLASERRMSQEGESEEENSQEENSEPEEEEEEEAEGIENLQKEDEMIDGAAGDTAAKPPSSLATPSTAAEVESSRAPPGESTKASGKGRSSYRARNKRGSRARASKDASKLLLLYDEDILERDPLREQKDLAFAQAYLTRVREALQHVPGKYEDFLQVIYEFESSTQRQTAMELYKSLQILLQDWPQLLKDFAAFLLPEQALACGLFEEQQAFEKSRKFLRQLEICFAENPSHHQKIIKVLQGCSDCLPQEITELRTQMWQLLKGHDHLQDEFSIFFDHLRPAASRMGDFEEINWTEEKEYEFDGFEEVALPDVEEEEEPSKIPTASKSKRRKEIGVQHHDKVCDSKSYKSKDPHELVGSSPYPEASPMPGTKEAGQGKDLVEEEALEEQENGAAQSRTGRTSRKGETPLPGSVVGTVLSSPEVALMEQLLQGLPPCSPEIPACSSAAPRPPAEAVAPMDASELLPDTAATKKPPSAMEPPASLRTRDMGKQHASGKAECRAEAEMTGKTSPSVDTLEPAPQAARGAVTKGSGVHGKAPEWEQQPKATEATVCANNSKVSSTGEKVVLWTREADRVILTMCQEQGAQPQTFGVISQQLGNKTPAEVSHRFRELMQLFHTACEASSEEEDDATSTSNADQLSDRGDLLSDEELDE
uniref:GON-4-like protein isoform X2 n=1 Tax=Jaculus jaculus TaxID=51337 RepID=UPI001E1B3B9B|nr:GON-4-like protein isoform X2 [Jaculus jaculus]